MSFLLRQQTVAEIPNKGLWSYVALIVKTSHYEYSSPSNESHFRLLFK